MIIYIGEETGNYYWLQDNVLMCSPMYQNEHILDTNNKDEKVEVDFDNISEEEQAKCQNIFQRLGGIIK